MDFVLREYDIVDPLRWNFCLDCVRTFGSGPREWLRVLNSCAAASLSEGAGGSDVRVAIRLRRFFSIHCVSPARL